MKSNIIIKLVLLILFLGTNFFLQAQDLLVTNNGDTLNCKITNIKQENIYFTFKHKNEIRNTLLPLTMVQTYRYNYFLTKEVTLDDIKINKNYTRLRFAVDGGKSYQMYGMPHDIDYEFKQYLNDLRIGSNFSGDITFFFIEQVGVGIKGSYFNASNEYDGQIYIMRPDSTVSFGKMSDNITVSFIGPFISSRYFNSKKTSALFLNMALGYLQYQNKMVVVDKYITTGSTLGLMYEIGYDYEFDPDWFVGAKLSYIMGFLSHCEISDGERFWPVDLEPEDYIGLNRFDLSIGIRYTPKF